MQIDYIFYSDTDKTASVKNALMTCEALSKENDVTYYGSIDNYNGLYEAFNLEGDFSYVKKSGMSNNIVSEAFKRLVFSFRTVSETKDKDSVIYTRDIFYLFVLSLPLVRKLVDRRVAYECHDVCDYTWKFPSFMEGRALKRADKIFYVSKGVKESLIERFNVDEHKLVLQRNCASIDKFNNVKEECLKDESFNIVYTGSNKERKGVKTLVNAFKTISTNSVEISLILVGPEDKSLEDENISVTGWVDENQLTKMTKSADLLIHPSEDTFYQRNYTCPMKLFEYMATKKMIIASDLPTTREIAGDTVMYFKPGDIQDLSKKIKNLIDNQENYEGDTEKAYETVSNNYTWGKKSDNINEVLENMR